MSIHIENLTINRLELHTGAEHGQEQEAEGSSSGPAATVGSAPTTPQALGWRRDGGDAAAELTWQLLAAPPPEPPSSADAGEAPEAEGSPPYWDDSGPREPELKPGSPEWGLHRTPSQVDDRDKGTPDEWIRRNPDMIRLTSKHPLNAEPPLSQLLEAGFHTPTALHYVRNHGAVPRIRWKEHQLQLTGLVERPCQISMDELTGRFPQHSVLSTMSCAGNRRREVQLVRRTQGFAWGHSAIATSEWSGVPLRELLLAAGVRPEARCIHFSGPEGEVAGGDHTYATSIPLWKGLDPLSEVVLAWRHNGRLLAPDHGYPLRVVIPGYIGGRCVKWLTKIELSAEESHNHYHQQDNKVLPSDVDQERANTEDWWSRPEFVCYNLNIGSVIAAPAHDEVVRLPPSSGGGGGGGGGGLQDAEATYTLRGFAHTGAGHLVIRAELSFDRGDSWHQAHIAEREPGRSAVDHNWCWVLWSCEVPLSTLAQAEEVRVRAWDDTMNTQPESPSWNLIGMMQNSHFIVKMRREEGPDGAQQLRFLHPVANGRDPGGWMVEETQRAGEAEGAAPSEEQQQEEEAQKVGKGWDSLRPIGWDEIKQHASRESCWFVRDGRVYDPTKFLEAHPGGPSAILSNAGQDASAEFDPIHSADARRMTLGMLLRNYAAEYLIGKVEGAPPPFKPGGQPAAEQPSAAAEGEQREASEEDAPALRKGRLLKARMTEKEVITHDTRRFRFALPKEGQRLGLPVGHHITIAAQIKGEKVVRPYTPVTLDHERGFFDLVIKVYHAGEDPKHPEGGKMSQHVDSLKEGDTIDVRGPYGEFTYLGSGRFTYKGREGRCRRINLLGGGTGITPIYQVMRSIMEEHEDCTELCLIFANKTPQDVLLRRRLQHAAETNPNKMRIHYTVDKADDPEGWHGSVGHISKEMLQEHAFPPDDSKGGGGGGAYKGSGSDQQGQNGRSGGTIALICGPPPMVEKACLPALRELGFDENHIIVF